MENSFNFLPDPTQIDPNLFALQWDVLIEVLTLVVVIAFVVERVLAVLFETRIWLKLSHEQHKKGQGTYKPLIAFIAALIVCTQFQIDLMAVLLSHPHVSFLGEAITAGVIAGGSKASLKLFKDILGVKKEHDATSK